MKLHRDQLIGEHTTILAAYSGSLKQLFAVTKIGIKTVDFSFKVTWQNKTVFIGEDLNKAISRYNEY